MSSDCDCGRRSLHPTGLCILLLIPVGIPGNVHLTDCVNGFFIDDHDYTKPKDSFTIVGLKLESCF